MLHKNHCNQKPFWKERVAEPRASQRGEQVLGLQSEPPAGGLEAEDKHVHCPRADRALGHNGLQEEPSFVSGLKEFTWL